MNHYPSEFYGNSVSKSFNTQITGIPGYERTANKKGAVEFQRLAPYNSNYEAGIEFEFTNFTKPAGVYSTTNARKITLGGNALPAVISGDADTQYEAEEVLLKNGFLTNQGAIFTAKSLKDNNSDHQNLSGNKEQEEKAFQRSEIMKAFRNAYPDFPWYLFDPSSEIVIIDDRKSENGLSNDQLFNPANLNERPEVPISQNQGGLFLQFKGHDKRLRYPIKQNNNNLTNR